jgi:polyhydroxyalkanoate synthase
MPTAIPGEAIRRIRHEAERARLRARNGVRYVAGPSIARVGSTPKDLVWERDKARLWRYRSDAVRYRPPVVIFIGLVSRSYVLDLHPGNSFVERLRDAGFDVFMLDWGVADEVEAENGLEVYVDFYLPRALAAAADEAGTADVTLLGYCMGALFALLMLGSRRNELVRNLVVMAPPVDFSETPELVTPLRTGALEPHELIDEETGVVPASVIRNFFRARKPTSEAVQYANLWQNLWDDSYLEGHQAMAQWVGDHVPFPGVAFEQFVRMFLRENALVNGTARVGGRRVRLDRVELPVLSAVAERDELVPLESALPLRDLVPRAEFEELRVPAGHVGLVMGRKGVQVTMPGIVDWLARHSEEVPPP